MESSGVCRLHQKESLILPMLEHPGKNGTMVVHRKGKPASTGYEVMENFGKYSFIKFDLIYRSHPSDPRAYERNRTSHFM